MVNFHLSNYIGFCISIKSYTPNSDYLFNLVKPCIKFRLLLHLSTSETNLPTLGRWLVFLVWSLKAICHWTYFGR